MPSLLHRIGPKSRIRVPDKAFPGGGAPFTPASVAGLIGWWEADAGTSTTVDGAAISQWNDQSTGVHHATQATGANQPIYKAAIKNGLPVVRFNGTSQFFNTAMLADTLPFTLFAVCNPTNFAAARTILGAQASGGLVYYLDTTGDAKFDKQGVAAFGAATTVEPAATWGMLGVTCDATGIYQFYSNAAANGTSHQTSQTFTAAVLSQIGAGGGASFFLGDIAAVLKYSGVLSTVDRQSVESYLRTKWATP